MGSKLNIRLRREEPEDYAEAENLTREAFWNHHVPGCDEHYLLHIMRSAPAFINALDFIAKVDGKIAGNIVYTKAKIMDDSNKTHDVISFGPIAVLPEFQGMGVGRALIEYTEKQSKGIGL